MLKNALYIEKTDAVLADQYLENMFKVGKLVAQSKDKRAKRSYYNTADLPTDTLEEYEELRAA